MVSVERNWSSGMPVKNKIEDIWSRINKRSETECWEWTGCRSPKGYGLFGLDGKTRLAHRLAWETVHGRIMEGLFVCHKCDNPPCCNPGHLFIGTSADNIRDMFAKGRDGVRNRVGDNNPTSIFSNDDIVEIRTRRASGEELRSISNDFGVPPSHISSICIGKIYKSVGGPITRTVRPYFDVRSYERTRRATKIKAGLCVECSRPKDCTTIRCSNCKRYQKELRAARKTARGFW